MMWYLFDSPDGWCIAEEKNVMRVEGSEIEVGAEAQYWFKGKEYGGVLKFKDGKGYKCEPCLGSHFRLSLYFSLL